MFRVRIQPSLNYDYVAHSVEDNNDPVTILLFYNYTTETTHVKMQLNTLFILGIT